MATAEIAPPRRRRRRWPIVVLVLLVLLALLAVAAEFVARPIAADYVRDRIAAPLGVDRPSDVDVDLGSGSLLLQALSGHVAVVTATTDDAEIAGVSGRIRLVARNVAISDREAGSVRAEIAVPNQTALTALVSKDVAVDSVRFADDRLVVTKDLSLLGRSVPVVETLSVGADAGSIVFTPQKLTVAGGSVDLDGLRRGPLASALSGLTEPQSRCVNESLPAGIALKSARIDGSTLRLVASGIRVKLDGEARGTCG